MGSHMLWCRAMALLVLVVGLQHSIARAQSDALTVPVAEPAPVELNAPAVEPVRTRPMWSLVGAGAGIFIGTWGADIGLSFGYIASLETVTAIGAIGGVGMRSSYDTAPYLAWSLAPLIGPFVQVPVSNEFSHDDWIRGFHVLFGVLQWAGLAMLITGLVVREQVVPRRRALPPGIQASIVPQLGPQQVGLLVSGTF